VLRTGGVASVKDDGVGDVITTFTLLDLITYEYLKNKLGRSYREIFTVHEYLGRLDAAIAVASFRQSVSRWTEPELTFGPEAPVSVSGAGLVHPLLKNPVPNDLITDRSMLITGSNASGKSTYLKTAALAAVMAQSLCTVLADSYRSNAFYIYSSMALSDDLLSGESYYIVEIKSLKRILDNVKQQAPVFCVVDEVLRGTNTVERISASSQVLRALQDSGALCLAATHDIELCDLLSGTYRLFHFEEQVSEQETLFDYTLCPGKATSRNAIDLLRLMGVDQTIVQRAHDSANRYLETGRWQPRA
jgi:DNA mismatch repair ATPase MutS